MVDLIKLSTIEIYDSESYWLQFFTHYDAFLL